MVPTTASATETDLSISEYVEGSANNKAVELYNGTAAAIILSDYTMSLYANGNETANNTVTLEDTTLAPGDTYVMVHNQASDELKGFADNVGASVLNFNGDDAIVLYRDGEVVDAFGQVGVQEIWGRDVTLRRNVDVPRDTDPSDPFDPAEQWETFPQNTFDHLGIAPGSEPGGPGEPEPDPAIGECLAEALAIGEVQGDGDATPLAGETVIVEGVVVGDFQEGGFDGYYIQDEGDDNDATSDGIFVYDRDRLAGDVAVGDALRVMGSASEYFDMTQITATAVVDCGDGTLPEATVIDFPNDDFEQYEGMLVTFDEPLTVLELFQFGRYGQIAVGPERQFQPTATHAPGQDAWDLRAANLANRVLIDDGRGNQNPTPAIHPATLEPLTMDNLFRAGDRISDVEGILDYRFSNWAIQPTVAGEIESVLERPGTPEVDGDLQIAAFNVLNYFTTLDSRGAVTEADLVRQEDKIVAAINKIDAGIVALNEIENNGDALVRLVDALNDAAGSEKWAGLETGVIGTDQITTAFIYQPSVVEAVGDWDILTTEVDARFDDTRSRPTLAQTFRHTDSDELVTVAANHLKSKGSECGDPSEAELGDLVGSCNETRVAAAEAMIDWLAGDAIGVEPTENIMIIGDLNSYDHEDPIVTFAEAGYADLAKAFEGEDSYSYVFDGQLGYLDYALANEALQARVVDVQNWHINSDELPLIDYTTQFKQPAEQALYAPDEFRSSDHDPVIVGIQFGEVPVDPTDPPTNGDDDDDDDDDDSDDGKGNGKRPGLPGSGV